MRDNFRHPFGANPERIATHGLLFMISVLYRSGQAPNGMYMFSIVFVFFVCFSCVVFKCFLYFFVFSCCLHGVLVSLQFFSLRFLLSLLFFIGVSGYGLVFVVLFVVFCCFFYFSWSRFVSVTFFCVNAHICVLILYWVRG